MTLPGIMWLTPVSVGAPPATIAFGSSSTSGSSAGISSGTFANMAINSADATRIVIAGFTDNSTGGVTSCTIGGITAVKAAGIVLNSSSNTSLWTAAVPTGTTANVSFTLTSTSSGINCMTWSTTKLLSATPVASNTASVNSAATSISAPSTTTQSGGVAIVLTGGDVGTNISYGTPSGSFGTTFDIAGGYANVAGCGGSDFYITGGQHMTTTGTSISETFAPSSGAFNGLTGGATVTIVSWR